MLCCAQRNANHEQLSSFITHVIRVIGVASHRLQDVRDVQTSNGGRLSKELIEAVPIP